MLNCLSGVPCFFQSNGEGCVTIRIRRTKQERAPTDLDRAIEFTFVQQCATETVMGEEVIRVGGYRLLVVSDCFINPALLEQRITQRDLSLGIVGSHAYIPLTMENRLLHIPFAKKGRAEIVFGVPRVGLHSQSRPVVRDALIDPAFLEKDETEIGVS